MTKDEMIALLKKSKLSEAAMNVKNAEDTLENIQAKEVKTPVSKGEGIKGLDSELPTQKEIEKMVDAAKPSLVAADKDGVSKDGGEDDRMNPEKIENERKKQDAAMKDVVNVSQRKVAEASEIHTELLAQMKEATAREEQYKKKIAQFNVLCEKALAAQAKILSDKHASQMKKIIESIIVEGEKLESKLNESIAKNEKMYKKANKLYESSTRLNKILLEAVKDAQPKHELKRYTTFARAVAEGIAE